MTANQPRAEQSSRDRIVEEVADKVEQSPSVDAPRDEILARAEGAVDGLVDKPVQTFTPLLAQNEVLGGLMEDAKTERSESSTGDGGQHAS